MKIALGVARIKDKKKEENLIEILKLIKKACRSGCEAIFFGESSLNGFEGLTWNKNYDLENNAVSLDSEVIREIRELAGELKIITGVGYFEKVDEGEIYSSYLVVDKNGETLLNYRRISPGWREQDVDLTCYREGNETLELMLGKERFVLGVCGDIWDDKLCGEIRGKTAEKLLWPLYIDYSLYEWREVAESEYLERVKEVGKETFIINSYSDEKNGAKGGAFRINSKGEVVDKLEHGESGLLITHI